MPNVSVLNVLLHDHPIATLTLVQGGRTLFAFNQDYVDDSERATLSLSFKDQFGGLITNHAPTQRVLPPFFSNLLPEGPLRSYLADRASVHQEREFFLLWMLGKDLPGAISIKPVDGEELPPEANEAHAHGHNRALRFSLAGVQLKFSAIRNEGKGVGLTIPAEGAGGSWIVKMPSQQFSGVPENEYAMMSIAGRMGMDVPDIQLIDLEDVDGLPDGIGELRGQALAVKRFDRSPGGSVHIEDFAQVFSKWPADKYTAGSYRSIAKVLGIETGEDGIVEYVRRIIFNTLIGNADMHLKNWSLIYPNKKTPRLAPAYDFLSTIPYLQDETAALKYSRTKRMYEVSKDEIAHLASKALLPEKIVVGTALDTVRRFRDIWEAEKTHFPLAKKVIEAVEAHAARVPIYNEA
ncbi:type II toxin-antitoxin system HipA family toxin [Ferrovibrio sp.]|uniref:type II toxin-antitoxin system HipA family toxin n=1 Tax=Ferrovibrio sp. TaxID=1917215 RepID=UPI000CBB142C|nr:MAG: kinase [Ferrovibrio sp.]